MGDSNCATRSGNCSLCPRGAQAKIDGVRTRRDSLHQVADILLRSVQLPAVLLRCERRASFVCVVNVLRRTVVHTLAHASALRRDHQNVDIAFGAVRDGNLRIEKTRSRPLSKCCIGMYPQLVITLWSIFRVGVESVW
jgi:hypothetical protein